MELRSFLARRPTRSDALELSRSAYDAELSSVASELRDRGWGRRVSYSRKVFVPLTTLCRDVCHYCTFAQTPKPNKPAFLLPEQVLAIARRGRDAGCKEVLFTLGDKPEARYATARKELKLLGFGTTLEYLECVAKLVKDETGLLPHLNPGLMDAADYGRLRRVAPSMGIMLESSSERLCQRGGPHFGSPDKMPERRIASLREAGIAKVPMTSGILIGIGESREERLEALMQLRDIHAEYGHLQEIIVQNFRSKPGTLMASAAEPTMNELCWTVAAARLIFGSSMSIQAPPNLFAGDSSALLAAGINDWGGISPITPDHVNPEAQWPTLQALRDTTEQAGYALCERLTVYPSYIRKRTDWIDSGLHGAVLKLSDAEGLARVGRWSPGAEVACDEEDERELPSFSSIQHTRTSGLFGLLKRLVAGATPTEKEVVKLFQASGNDLQQIFSVANELRSQQVGERVSYVITRNINYTNVCTYKCGFCAFSKGKAHESLRGKPYLVDIPEIQRRVREAWARGATEVCMQGGIHPEFTGQTYIDICRAAKGAVPDIHVHAFSPLEVSHGAATLNISASEFLQELKRAGLGSLPGTAAEILDDDIRQLICPDKLTTKEWLDLVGTAHEVGVATTSTIMFGHAEHHVHWARHLLRLREQQQQTGGFTEFVPLPFVHMEAPIYLRGRARAGPTLRETLLMHAVARLVLNPLISNIQVSWVKLGARWAKACLDIGANDLGGTLMNESISRAAGASFGQEMSPDNMQSLIRDARRTPWQRTTLYKPAPIESAQRAAYAEPLAAPVNAPLIFRRPEAAHIATVKG